MAQESAQTFNLIMITVAVLLQTIFLIGIALSVVRMRKSVEQFTGDVRKFLQIAGRSAEILNLNITQISQTVQNRLEQADHMTDEFLSRSRAHALAIDRLIGNLLRTAEHANHELEQFTRRAFR